MKHYLVDISVSITVAAESEEQASELAIQQLKDNPANLDGANVYVNNEDGSEIWEDINDPEQEIIKFTLAGDPETYYTISHDYMNDHAEDEGKEVENWGIAVDGLPPAAVAIATNIYIDYGVRSAQ